MNKTLLIIGTIIFLCVPIFLYSLIKTENAESKTSSALVDTEWTWEKTISNDDSTTIPANPENYTLRFDTGGNISVKADCNQGQGIYKLEKNNKISIKINMMTQAYCGDESLDQVFLRDLSSVDAYNMQNEKLYLNLQYDAGSMIFRN